MVDVQFHWRILLEWGWSHGSDYLNDFYLRQNFNQGQLKCTQGKRWANESNWINFQYHQVHKGKCIWKIFLAKTEPKTTKVSEPEQKKTDLWNPNNLYLLASKPINPLNDLRHIYMAGKLNVRNLSIHNNHVVQNPPVSNSTTSHSHIISHPNMDFNQENREVFAFLISRIRQYQDWQLKGVFCDKDYGWDVCVGERKAKIGQR